MTDDTTTALERLAHAAAEAVDDGWTIVALAAAVTDLERVAVAELGPAEHDPLVVMQRRLGRVHRLLAAAEPGDLRVEVVRAHLLALSGAAPAPQTCRGRTAGRRSGRRLGAVAKPRPSRTAERV